MSRDIVIHKTKPDTSKISLPLLFINPQFGYSVDNIIRYIRESPDSFLKPDAFPHDIKEYFWIQEGIPGSKPWYCIGCLQEYNLFFFFKAFTYTMFDKDGHMDLWVSHRFSDLIQYAMDTMTYTTYITDIRNKISDGLTSDPVVSRYDD